MPRHDEVRVPGDEEALGGGVAARLEVVELGDEHAGVDDAARSDGASLAADDPARDLPDLVRLVADDDRVAGVRPALIAADEVGVLREQVDDLPLPLVAPLGADDDGRGHGAECCTPPRGAPPTRLGGGEVGEHIPATRSRGSSEPPYAAARSANFA